MLVLIVRVDFDRSILMGVWAFDHVDDETLNVAAQSMSCCLDEEGEDVRLVCCVVIWYHQVSADVWVCCG